MHTLEARYRTLEPVPSAGGRACGGNRISDGLRVIIKCARSEYPRLEELAELRYEFSVLRRLADAGAQVARPLELVRHGHSEALVSEPAAGRELSEIIAEGAVDPVRFCRVAVALANCLESVHAAGIIHRDVKPSHFFVDEGAGTATLIDFGLASDRRERTRATSVECIEGTLAYVPPEQTGRTNRSVDQRSDLYSLGVTLYELGTGQRPFRGDDALDLIHAHLARNPPSLSQLRPQLPAVLSDIVMRLLQKAPEHRYQTASGLRADLARALSQLVETGAAERFELARDDHPAEVRSPEELYGREQQARELAAAFERVRDGATELVLLTGSAGVGKSALVQGVKRELLRGGHFVSGKFDQYDRGVPYSALATACGEIVRMHLTATSAELEEWKQRVNTALGVNARVVADVVPELEIVLGTQPPVVPLSPSEAQTRFERSFQRFIQASPTKASPLLLFLDDLQWADAASLAVLRQVLSSSDQQHLLVIGSYRDEEVDARHPLSLCLEALKERLPVRHIQLGPLERADVERLVGDALPFRSLPIEPLAQLIHDKTSGNPFFVVQFLRRLEAEGLLVFREGRGFSWDIERIAELEATENVVALMVSRLARLESTARELLSLAACIGHTFEFSALAGIAAQDPRELVPALRAAIAEGFLVPLDRNHRILGDLLEVSETNVDAKYRFAHDRVQQAAYLTITEGERSQVHLRIGRRLLERLGENVAADAELFEVVGQLNRGRGHLTEGERSRLARLNLRAAERADAAQAHDAALGFSSLCLELVGEDPWAHDHAVALAAHRVAIVNHYLAGNEERALDLIQVVEDRAQNAIEREPVRTLKLDLLTKRGKLQEAIRFGLETLALLGEPMPDPNDKAALKVAIGAAFGAFQASLGTREVASLRDLPSMSDPQKLAQLATMAGMMTAAFQGNAELNVLITLRAVQLSLDGGSGPTSPFFYAHYGIVHRVITNDYARAFQFGELSLDLAQRPEYAAVRARIHLIFATLLSPWVRPLNESFEHFEKAVAFGMEGGDVTYAGYSMGAGVMHRLYAGEPLSDIRSRIPPYRAALTQTGDVINLTFLNCVERVIECMTGNTAHFGSLDGPGFSEAAFETQAVPTTRATYGINKALVRYLAGDAEAAREATEKFQPLPGPYYNSEYTFYHGMACAELATHESEKRRAELLLQLDADIEKFRVWSSSCAENFGARAELLCAERDRLRGDREAALDAYERAVVRATASSNVLDLAIACERAGRFHHARGRQRLAAGYLSDASHHYDRWGATAKVSQLSVELSNIARYTPGRAAASGTRSSKLTSSTSSGSLDLTSAVRATQAIASELQLEPLLHRLLQILVENAGATHGCLVLPRGSSFEVRASLVLEQEAIEANLHEPLEASSRLPASIVQYCARSRVSVVLSDASRDARFLHDPRVIERGNHSVACLPLVHQGRLAAVLYLENRASTAAFHAGRIERLEFLGGHAAVALHNALLYEQLEDANATLERRVEERTAELSGRNADMRRVLDNTAQGLLTVDLQGRLSSERSAVVDEWFGGFEPGCRVVDYLARFDPKFALMFESAFKMLAEAYLPEEVVLDQLPAQMSYRSRHFRFGYQPIRGADGLSGILIVVDDVSQALKREREEAEQAEQLAICTWLSRDRMTLLGFFEEGRALVETVCNRQSAPTDLRAPLHTLKGNAATLDLNFLASLCHRAETAIDEGSFDPTILAGLKDRWSALEATLDLLLGRDGRNRLEISRTELKAILSLLRAGASTDEAIELLERLELRPLSQPLRHLGERAVELSRRLGRVEPVIRVDDHGLVGEPQQGSKVWAALVHLIRNAVDHGLERPHERRASGKAFPATLELGARRDGSCVLIEIADDGKGIDWSRIQERAQQRGLASTSRADLTEALFATALSTRDELSETSGRGMGLDAVRREIRALGGSIEVESERGQGCRFKLRVPSAALGVHPLAPKRSGGASRPPPAPEQRPARD